MGLALAGTAAGALNALAGGGGFIVLPALMMAGSSAILANTTGSVAVWPGVLATWLAFRRGLGPHRKALPKLSALVIAGSLGGSILLLLTPNPAFLRLLPWLLLGATLLFLFSRPLTESALRLGLGGQRGHSLTTPALMTLIAVYGGYFGGGMGIMTLAALALMGIEDMHELNALKSALVFCISTVSVLFFIAKGAVEWRYALPMMAGNLIGGYAASHWALGLPKNRLRRIIGGMCVAITLAYFIKTWL